MNCNVSKGCCLIEVEGGALVFRGCNECSKLSRSSLNLARELCEDRGNFDSSTTGCAGGAGGAGGPMIVRLGRISGLFDGTFNILKRSQLGKYERMRLVLLIINLLHEFKKARFALKEGFTSIKFLVASLSIISDLFRCYKTC